VSKGKLRKFEEMKTFSNVIQPAFDEVFHQAHPLKGQWKKDFFNNPFPLTLELGCGKGEYTVGLACMYPERNFLGVDIKGSRMWKGASVATQQNINNVGFLRTRIELINSFFDKNEVDEIWLTFPDPQLKKSKKRLTSSRFLNVYKSFLKPEGKIHLKTDNEVLYNYTMAIAGFNHLNIEMHTSDLYHSGLDDDILSIKTYYEKQYLELGMPIHYICFQLNGNEEIKEPPEEY
jgi:tRNA (guanine-N7-)-methyltransferase